MLLFEALFGLCWVLVIAIIVTIKHFPAILPYPLVLCDISQEMLVNRKIIIFFLPLPLLALITCAWRYCRRSLWRTPLPPSTSCTINKSDDVTVELPIVNGFVGFVIGRQGSRIKELEKQTNTKIRFREAKDGKVAMITGEKDNVERAKEAIEMIIKDKSEKKQTKTIDVLVPNFAVGRLIGKQGQNISAIQKESGARITVDTTRRGSGPTRLCTISGTSDQVSRGVTMVQHSIDESEAAQQRNKLNRKLKTDNINMKTAQIHSKCKVTKKESPPSQQTIPLKPCVLPSDGDFFPAFVSNVTVSGHVWIQQVTDTATVLDDLTNAMMDTYCNMDPMEHKMADPSSGSHCAAKFSSDGQWYRAQVISTTSTTAHLLFVDYGDEEWHPISCLKTLLPQFCTLPIQACECQLQGVSMPTSGWSKGALEVMEDVTMCAKWEPVMIKITDHTSNPPSVTIVNTTGNIDVDVATKFIEHVSKLPCQQELSDETVTMEMSTQLESSNNMFDNLEESLQQLDDDDDDKHSENKALQKIDYSSNQDDQHSNDLAIQTSHYVNIDQDDQHGHTADYSNATDDQNNIMCDPSYEVQGVSVTFDSDSDDDDQVMLHVEEDINETWLHSSDHIDTVSVTIVKTEHNSKHTPNCVSVTPYCTVSNS